MYYIYAVMLYLFVLFISLFVLKMFSISTKVSNEFFVMLINADADIKKTQKRIREIYYEQTLAGKNGVRGIIIVDKTYRESFWELCDGFENVDYVLLSELDDYLTKRTGSNE